MSWVNRNLPRKRDLTQIPVEYRPTIIPRDQQPLVVQSEQFKMVPPEVPQNVYPSLSSDSSNKRTVSFAPAPQAKELRHDERTYVFVILRHIRTTKDNDLWIAAYQSIRQYYTNPIMIIDDNSRLNTVNGKLVNTEVIYSDFPGAGELLPYYYFLKNHWADRMVFLHDSMSLVRPFRTDELQAGIQFHWHFTNKQEDRPPNTYLTMLNQADNLLAFAQTSSWRGCFGGASIVDYEIVERLEDEYTLFSTLVRVIRTRADRERLERVLGVVVAHAGLLSPTYSTFGDIMEYPNAFESLYPTSAAAVDAMKQSGYHSAIAKIWRGR